jgi:glycosyltransferase involved in cell wall biosynthesis
MPQKGPTAIICLSPYLGGMELDSIRLFKLLKESSSVLICQKDSKLEKKAYEQLNDKDIESISFSSNLGPALIFGLRKIFKQRSIKNVIFFGASELKSIHFAIKNLGINLIVRHGTTKTHRKKDWFHRLIYSQVNWHVAVSDHILRNVRDIIPFAKHTQGKRIYLSRDIQEKPHVHDENKIKIINVGRVCEAKGQMEAIKALKALKDNGTSFEMSFLGSFDEPFYEKLISKVKEYGLENQVTFHGHVDNVIEHISRSDVFLFPSYGEGLPNALVEAMAMGLTPVVFENTVFPEIKDLGFYIFIAKNKDVESLRTHLLEVSQDIQKCRKEAQINKSLYKKYFTPELEKESYLEILK